MNMTTKNKLKTVKLTFGVLQHKRVLSSDVSKFLKALVETVELMDDSIDSKDKIIKEQANELKKLETRTVKLSQQLNETSRRLNSIKSYGSGAYE